VEKDHASRNSSIKAYKDRAMKKKLIELHKHYPKNKYEIKEVEVKSGKISNIVRIEGIRPHKIKKPRETGVE
jgi:hypothetical protein